MSNNSILNKVKIAVTVEDAEGVYKAPSVGTEFLQPESDGLEMKPTRALLDRKILNGSIGKSEPILGMHSVATGLQVEAKSGSTAGSLPEWDALMRATLGLRFQTGAVTTKSGNTTNTLQLQDADVFQYQVGSVVLVNGTFVSPISAVNATPGSASITLLISSTNAFADSSTISPAVNYKVANEGHPSLSMTKYIEDTRTETAWGLRVKSLSVDSFSTGAMAKMKYALDGIDMDSFLGAPTVVGTRITSKPAAVLRAKIFQNGVELKINELTLQVENALGKITSTSSIGGLDSQIITERSVSGSINPYKDSNSVAQWLTFTNSQSFSIFAYICNPDSTSAGHIKNIVSFYLPNCMIKELTEANKEGVLQDAISFNVTRGAAGDIDELFIGSI